MAAGQREVDHGAGGGPGGVLRSAGGRGEDHRGTDHEPHRASCYLNFMRRTLWSLATLALLLGACGGDVWPSAEGGATIAIAPASRLSARMPGRRVDGATMTAASQRMRLFTSVDAPEKRPLTCHARTALRCARPRGCTARTPEPRTSFPSQGLTSPRWPSTWKRSTGTTTASELSTYRCYCLSSRGHLRQAAPSQSHRTPFQRPWCCCWDCWQMSRRCPKRGRCPRVPAGPVVRLGPRGRCHLFPPWPQRRRGRC
jgi:hypothetical protein